MVVDDLLPVEAVNTLQLYLLFYRSGCWDKFCENWRREKGTKHM